MAAAGVPDVVSDFRLLVPWWSAQAVAQPPGARIDEGLQVSPDVRFSARPFTTTVSGADKSLASNIFTEVPIGTQKKIHAA